MRDTTLSELDRLGAATDAAEETFHMDEDAFRLFYDRTSRAVWAYLSRATGDPRQADDLLQETYYRFLRANAPPSDEAHRKNYLFRIATNLVNDTHRRPRLDAVQMHDKIDQSDPRHDHDADGAARRVDLSRALARLKPRERDLLWLAYAQGSSHREIADVLGLRTSSIKLLLFRARRRLASMMREGGR